MQLNTYFASFLINMPNIRITLLLPFFPLAALAQTGAGNALPVRVGGGTMDTTVNNTLKLLDPASIRQNIGDQRKNMIEDDKATADKIHFRVSGSLECLYI